MQRLTAKKTLIATFSLIIAFSVSAVFIGFFFYFKDSLTNLIKKDLSEEVNEIVNAFVISENKKLVFTLNPEGLSLREELIKDGISGIFFDKNLDLVKGFGAFEIYSSSDAASLKNLLSLSSSSLIQNQVTEDMISWQGQNYIVYVVPLRSGEENLGIAILGKPITILESVWESLLSSVLTFGLVALLGGFILVFLVVKKAFNPIEKLNNKIDDIDFKNLNQSIQIEGPLDDEFVQLSIKINQMLDRIKISSERQQEFISNASHELKTPLSLAISSLDVLNTSQQSVELLEVRDDLLSLGKLIDQLLILSGLHGGNIDKNSKNYLITAVEEALKLHQHLISEKKLKIETNVSPNVLVKIPETYLKLIINNLISNSVKYSKENGHVKIGTSIKNDLIEFTVQDFGDGISSEDLPHIFERFYTTSRNAKSLKRKGHGIGLAIVKNICDEFDITYRAESEKDKGTSIILGFC